MKDTKPCISPSIDSCPRETGFSGIAMAVGVSAGLFGPEVAERAVEIPGEGLRANGHQARVRGRLGPWASRRNWSSTVRSSTLMVSILRWPDPGRSGNSLCRKLIGSGRIFQPARVATEFVRVRWA